MFRFCTGDSLPAHTFLSYLLLSSLELSEIQQSMNLIYEPSSEPLHISVKKLADRRAAHLLPPPGVAPLPYRQGTTWNV